MLPAAVFVCSGPMVTRQRLWFDGVADNVYKFSPVRARPEDLARFHGTNERISTANYVEMIQFYHQLIGNASSADTSQDRSIP